MTRTPILAANWKMHKTIAEAEALVQGLLADLGSVSGREVVVCPPFTALATVRALLADTPVMLGAQDMFYAESGAYTGEVSPAMLRDAGCQYVIVGHSERREIIGEDDALVNKKLLAALAHGLVPIGCVGESKAQRDAGEAEAVVVRQIEAAFAGVTAAQVPTVVIAYEPIWAIGTGETATPADAQAMHALIRQTVARLYDDATAAAVRIQYGGSVKPNNVDELMAQPDIDGALVGGASLKAPDFLRIVHYQ